MSAQIFGPELRAMRSRASRGHGHSPHPSCVFRSDSLCSLCSMEGFVASCVTQDKLSALKLLQNRPQFPGARQVLPGNHTRWA